MLWRSPRIVSRRRRRHRHSHCTTLVVFSRAAHIRVIVQRYVLPSRRHKTPQRSAASALRAAAACSNVVGLRDISHQCVFTHAESILRHNAGSSWIASRSTLAARTNRSPGAARRSPWRCQRRPSRRSGSLMLLVAPSSGRHAPCRRSGRLTRPCGAPAGYGFANARQGHRIGSFVVAGSIETLRHVSISQRGRFARPRSTSAAMAAPTASAALRRLAFSSLPFFVSGVLSRRPPLSVPSGSCLRQTPSAPPIGYRPSYGCRFR
jgi:hypothetical protein